MRLDKYSLSRSGGRLSVFSNRTPAQSDVVRQGVLVVEAVRSPTLDVAENPQPFTSPQCRYDSF
jgi:hypothetical protein